MRSTNWFCIILNPIIIHNLKYRIWITPYLHINSISQGFQLTKLSKLGFWKGSQSLWLWQEIRMIVTRYLNGGDQNFVWWWPKISMVVTGYWNGGDRILKWWWPEVCMTVTENRYGGDRKSVWEWPNSLSLWPKVYIFEWKFRRLWSDFVCCEQKFGWMVVKIIIFFVVGVWWGSWWVVELEVTFVWIRGGEVRWWCTVRQVVLFEVDGGGK